MAADKQSASPAESLSPAQWRLYDLNHNSLFEYGLTPSDFAGIKHFPAQPSDAGSSNAWPLNIGPQCAVIADNGCGGGSGVPVPGVDPVDTSPAPMPIRVPIRVPVGVPGYACQWYY